MKKGLLSLVLATLALGNSATAEVPAVNLTPTPKEISVSEGELILPASFTIDSSALPADMAAEVTRFAAELTVATGLDLTSGTALFSISQDKNIAPEGYSLKVTADGVEINASTAAGLFYAFNTVKKLLPVNVMAGVFQSGQYALPLVNVNDEPLYAWRGMELDCARHYFEPQQLKKMIDVMAAYKMNRLHWHLTDDQGWRLEMPKYPRLTTEAACPVNQYWCDFDTKTSYLTNEPYGPYFYTVEEMKDLVAYAKERHIEICPEIDLPGHMQAAIAAYPEFSTVPEAEHPVRYWPGVSHDILDVSNPAVVQFTKDIMDQLIEIFPYEYIHIGGDECPTGYWANSPACQQFKKDNGLKTDRAIQSWLIKQLADYVRPQGKKLMCWNEVITSDGADTKLAQEADIMIHAWVGNNGSSKAAELGLRSVWCNTGYYYIDYPQWSGASEPLSMGGAVNLQTVYNVAPAYDEAKKEFYYGVQCNLWTEYVCENKHLEYNALPRMLAVAETGWTPRAAKNWDSFLARFRQTESKYLDMAGYTYGKHYLEGANFVAPKADKWYRLVTMATNNGRTGRCIELIAEGSPAIAEVNAQVGKLWSAPQAAEGASNIDYQYWTFEADPAGSGKYAMVCRASAAGSVNPTMSGSSTGALWSYDASTKHYGFVLTDNFGEKDGQYTYSIRSEKGANHFINAGTQGNNLAINNWSSPTDGNGGIWFFDMEGYQPDLVVYPAFTPLESGKQYVFSSALDPSRRWAAEYEGLQVSTDPWANVIWTVEDANYNSTTNVQTFRLKNSATGQYLANLSEPATTNPDATGYGNGAFSGDLGAALFFGSEGMTLSLTATEAGEYIVRADGKMLFPLPEASVHAPNIVGARPNVPRIQGGTWLIREANPQTYNITDGETSEVRTVEALDPVTSPWPCFAVKSCEEQGSEWLLTLERELWAEVYSIYDTDGICWGEEVDLVPVGSDYQPAAPELPYMKDGSIEKTGDHSYKAVYTPIAARGVAYYTEPITSLVPGRPLLIENNHATRHNFRCATAANTVSGAREAVGVSPSYVWAFDPTDDALKFSVRNCGNGLYVQKLATDVPATLAEEPAPFSLSCDDNGFWHIKNGSGAVYWDTRSDFTLIGWNVAPGHEHTFYDFVAAPYYTITIDERDQYDNLLSSRQIYVEPGRCYNFVAASKPDQELLAVEGADDLNDIQGHKLVTVRYTVPGAVPPESDLKELSTINHQPSTIYDLQGRRVLAPSRGIYIINGTKTLVK